MTRSAVECHTDDIGYYFLRQRLCPAGVRAVVQMSVQMYVPCRHWLARPANTLTPRMNSLEWTRPQADKSIPVKTRT